jgi:hypothetical protein
MKFLMALLLTACSTTNQPTNVVQEAIKITLPEIEVIDKTPIRVEAIIQTGKGLERSTEKLFRVVAMLERVINNPELEQAMLKAWWDGKPGFQDTTDTPEQAVSKLFKNGDWVVQYAFKRNFYKSVTAWTFPSDPVVYLNTRNFLGRRDCPIVGSLAHERSHKLNYAHKNANRSLSLPYYLGTQVTLICEKMLKAGQL